MTADEYYQGVAESQIPDPYSEAIGTLEVKMQNGLFAEITDYELECLADKVRFLRGIENGSPF